MKKIILFFTALAVMAPFAFAADHYPWEDPAMCEWRAKEGLPPITVCEKLIEDGQPLTKKCCWNRPTCANYAASGFTVPTSCENVLENGQHIYYISPTWCCWESRENASNLGNGKGNDKGPKKTHVQAPKGKQGAKVQPVKANTAKAPAQAKVQAQTKTVTKK